MKSMTGFACVSAEFSEMEKLWIEVTVRAVNGRYFEMRFHMPRSYMGLEGECRKLIGESFQRGHVDLFIKRAHWGSHREVFVDKELAGRVHEGFEELLKSLGQPQEVDFSWLIRSFPEVLRVEEALGVSPEEKRLVFDLLSKACKECDKGRRTEGKKLKRALSLMVKELNNLKCQAGKVHKGSFVHLVSRVREKCEVLGIGSNEALVSEVISLLDRGDITEELDRLSAHLEQVTALLNSSGVIGRRLDFYAQELLREINTIGSKSQSADLTALVVEGKSLVEKFREQVQNIE